MSNEARVQAEARNELARQGGARVKTFRANVGRAWQSNDIEWLDENTLVLRNPRPFTTGLPEGFSDLFGGVEQVITAEMVGRTLLQFFVVEMKDKGKLTEKQAKFLAAIKAAGGRAGMARSAAEACEIVLGTSPAAQEPVRQQPQPPRQPARQR